MKTVVNYPTVFRVKVTMLNNHIELLHVIFKTFDVNALYVMLLFKCTRTTLGCVFFGRAL